MAGYAQHFGPIGHAQAQGVKTASLIDWQGCVGFFMGHAQFPFVVEVNQINIERVAVDEPEDDPPVG